jgi:hypothetical protein
MAAATLTLAPCAVPAFRAVTHKKPSIYWPSVVCDAAARGDLETMKSAIWYATRARQTIDWTAALNVAIVNDRMCVIAPLLQEIALCGASRDVLWDDILHTAAREGTCAMFGVIMRVVCEHRATCDW